MKVCYRAKRSVEAQDPVAKVLPRLNFGRIIAINFTDVQSVLVKNPQTPVLF